MSTEKTELKKAELIKNIERAFDGVRLGNGIGLHQAQGMDDYATEDEILALRNKDEKLDWHKISFQDINRCGTSLCFFDAEGMRFHLPILMLYYLDGDEPGKYKYDGPDILFHLYSAVSGDPYSAEQYISLNQEQIQSVVDFLKFAQAKIDTNYESNQISDSIRKWELLLSNV